MWIKGLEMKESITGPDIANCLMEFIISNVASGKFVYRHQACSSIGDKLAFP